MAPFARGKRITVRIPPRCVTSRANLQLSYLIAHAKECKCFKSDPRRCHDSVIVVNHIISPPEPSTQSQPEARQQPLLIPPLGDPTSSENTLDPQSHEGQQPERMAELPMENSSTSIFRQVVELHSNLERRTVGSQPMTAIPDAPVPSSQDQVNAML